MKQKHIIKIGYLLFFVVIILILIEHFLFRESNEIKLSLNLAGENHTELEKVLAHYGKDKPNEKKLESAKYLIENMKWHFASKHFDECPSTLKSSFEYLDSLTHSTYYSAHNPISFEFVDTLHKILYTDFYIPKPEIIDSLIWLKNKDKFETYSTVDKTTKFENEVSNIGKTLLETTFPTEPDSVISYDLECITSSYLIEHIDNAFKVWAKSPFARGLTFAEFKETILPYRYRNEALDTKSHIYNNFFYNIVHSPDSINIQEVIRRFNFYTLCMDCFENEGKYLGNFGIYDIIQFYQFECGRHSEWTCKVLNSCGIPTQFHFTASWKNRDRHHFWVSVRDSGGKQFPFTPKWQLLYDSTYFERTSKVYRRTFAVQDDCPLLIKNKIEQVPQIFNSPYIKDITPEYHRVMDFSIELKNNFDYKNLAYIGIFSPKGWKPIGWGTINRSNRKVTFKDVPTNTMYIAGSYENEELSPFSNPFFINNQKEMEEIRPNLNNKIDLILTRKYPKKEKMIERMKSMCGSKIQGAKKRDFSDAVDLYSLNEESLKDLVIRAINIKNDKRIRYIRVLPPRGKMVNLAIFETYSKMQDSINTNFGSKPHIISYKEISIINTNRNLSLNKCEPINLGKDSTALNAVDGNMETYFSGFSLTLDLYEEIKLDQIRIAPRNANNGIVVGNSYELLYWHNGWKSAGIKIAEYNFLEYKDIPSNTIYWLKNKDVGKEELAFLYKEDNQLFINHDPIISIY